MKLQLITIPIALAVLVACDNAQHGRFVAGGCTTISVQPSGLLRIITGMKTDGDSEIVGGEKNLFFVLILHPQVPVASGGSGRNDGRYVSTFTHWITPIDQPTRNLEYQWDRRNHTLTIGAQTFDVAKGDLFVIHWELKDGSWGARQGGMAQNVPLIKEGNEAGAIRELMAAFKKAFPEDAEVQERQRVERN
jgi:hypothetical protein